MDSKIEGNVRLIFDLSFQTRRTKCGTQDQIKVTLASGKLLDTVIYFEYDSVYVETLKSTKLGI